MVSPVAKIFCVELFEIYSGADAGSSAWLCTPAQRTQVAHRTPQLAYPYPTLHHISLQILVLGNILIRNL
jgi:hypothetical protein